jgi:hypothetical protein
MALSDPLSALWTHDGFVPSQHGGIKHEQMDWLIAGYEVAGSCYPLSPAPERVLKLEAVCRLDMHATVA